MDCKYEFDPELDPGIRDAVLILVKAGVETFASCQGGLGHPYPEPTVRFHGEFPEGFRALAVALQHDLSVSTLRRVWSIQDGEPTGPLWELTFTPRATDPDTLWLPRENKTP